MVAVDTLFWCCYMFQVSYFDFCVLLLFCQNKFQTNKQNSDPPYRVYSEKSNSIVIGLSCVASYWFQISHWFTVVIVMYLFQNLFRATNRDTRLLLETFLLFIISQILSKKYKNLLHINCHSTVSIFSIVSYIQCAGMYVQ